MVVFCGDFRYGAFWVFLVADTEQVITAPVVETVLLFNPADILSPTEPDGLRKYSHVCRHGGFERTNQPDYAGLLTAQVLWVIIPLILAAWLFGKRQI